MSASPADEAACEDGPPVDGPDGAARAERDLEVLARVISHDLKEPLRTVSSYLALLDQGLGTEPDAACREYLAAARGGAARLSQMQQALQEYSRLLRMDAVQTELVQLSEVVRYLRAKLRETFENEGASLHESDLPAVVAAPSLLARALELVVDNSVKFRSDAPPQVTISAAPSGDDCIISVSDNGVGVEPSWHERAFELFQKLHPRRGLAGVGAGLAIARLAIERQHGQIWIEPSGTGGTQVKLRLPAAQEVVPR